MLQALDVQTGLPIAGAAARRDGRYVCPECGKLVCPRLGPRKLPHFAHYSTTLCTMSRPEGERHQALKWLCKDLFAPLSIQWEVAVGTRRADLVVGGLFVVECQVSPLSIDEWQARTANHNCHGYPVLWLWDVKRLCRKNTLAEALEMERRGRAVWTPAEIRHCHRENGELIYVADKHSMLPCRLAELCPGTRASANNPGSGWPMMAPRPHTMGKLRFWPNGEKRVHKFVWSRTGDLRLVRISNLDYF